MQWWRGRGGTAKGAEPPVSGPRLTDRSPEAFMQRVQKTSTCWLWTGARNDFGYGLLVWGDHQTRAHRVSYEIHVGPVNPDDVVRHDCDNPPCVNPEHLQVGTHADNVNDKVSRGRARGNPSCGEEHNQAKLTWEAVDLIREQRAKGQTVTALAKRYGVSRAAIRKAVQGKTWAKRPKSQL